ncbi:MAG: TetR/AcrR family transcriptional regulator [Chloroflexi bacterium]|nr:MAG: TetR/AcrR family transcriptional regulator [Chloroflexota bacterium]
MARIVKDPDVRRGELIATAQKLFYIKGYEKTSISDIVKAVGVAHGTFYYYFASKTAVLEAIVAEAVNQSQALLSAIVADETLDAITKWQQANQASSSWKNEQKEEMRELYRLLMRDENVLMQHKLRIEIARMTAAELAKIIAQGVEEGVFIAPFPQEAAEAAQAMIASFSDTVGRIMLNLDDYDDPATLAQRKRVTVQKAIEAMLNAPPDSLPVMEESRMLAWFED